MQWQHAQDIFFAGGGTEPEMATKVPRLLLLAAACRFSAGDVTFELHLDLMMQCVVFELRGCRWLCRCSFLRSRFSRAAVLAVPVVLSALSEVAWQPKHSFTGILRVAVVAGLSSWACVSMLSFTTILRWLSLRTSDSIHAFMGLSAVVVTATGAELVSGVAARCFLSQDSQSYHDDGAGFSVGRVDAFLHDDSQMAELVDVGVAAFLMWLCDLWSW